jgi:CheY-like chemotaxis protein
MMGGDIGVRRNKGGGSIFCFTLSCGTGESATLAPDGPLASMGDAAGNGVEETAARGLRILVAEDNSINQLVIKSMLEKAGHQVDLSNNGLEALDAVMRTDFDLVIMDVNMPEMDGLTATQRIRDLPAPKSQTPIIALTANAMKGDREKFINAGMDDYVSKPIDPGNLAMAIAQQCKTKVELLGLGADDDAQDDLTQEQKDAVEDLNDTLDQLFG